MDRLYGLTCDSLTAVADGDRRRPPGHRRRRPPTATCSGPARAEAAATSGSSRRSPSDLPDRPPSHLRPGLAVGGGGPGPAAPGWSGRPRPPTRCGPTGDRGPAGRRPPPPARLRRLGRTPARRRPAARPARGSAGAPPAVAARSTRRLRPGHVHRGGLRVAQPGRLPPARADPGRGTPAAGRLARSQFLDAPLGRPASPTVLAGIDERQGAAGHRSGVGFDACGGAINRVSPAATAFVHRHTLCWAQYSVSFDVGDGPAVTAASQAWLDAWSRRCDPTAAARRTRTTSTPPCPTGRRPTTAPTCPASGTSSGSGPRRRLPLRPEHPARPDPPRWPGPRVGTATRRAVVPSPARPSRVPPRSAAPWSDPAGHRQRGHTPPGPPPARWTPNTAATERA